MGKASGRTENVRAALGQKPCLREPAGMTLSKFEIRLTCACGHLTSMTAMLARPGGQAPLPCKCGRSFVLQQLDRAMVTRIAVDPTGTTDGEVPETLELPEVH